MNLSPALKLEGRSGCRLQIIPKEGVYFVRKYSKDASYNQRLLAQIKKQRIFFSENAVVGFSTPEVIEQSVASENEAWFDMPYVHGQKYSELFERSSISEIKDLSGKFIQYFKDQFNSAKTTPVHAPVFLEKVRSIRQTLSLRADIDQQLVDRTLAFLKILPAESLPILPCHGDFTFSNMLFSDRQILLVDFLDSFIESPLIDLVKYRQDTFFYWSLIIESGIPESRSSKIVQVFRYLDQEIVKVFKDNTFVSQWYDYLQIFNLIRILPYVHHPSEIQFVQRGISRIFTTLT